MNDNTITRAHIAIWGSLIMVNIDPNVYWRLAFAITGIIAAIFILIETKGKK